MTRSTWNNSMQSCVAMDITVVRGYQTFLEEIYTAEKFFTLIVTGQLTSLKVLCHVVASSIDGKA